MQGVQFGNRLPGVLLLHGTADTCAPVDNATQFADALREAGAQVLPSAASDSCSAWIEGAC